MSAPDFPDWSPIPPLSVVAAASGGVAANATRTLVDPGPDSAVRLWTASLLAVSNAVDTSSQCELIYDTGSGAMGLMQVDSPAAPDATGFGKAALFGYFGGIVLPRAAAVKVSCFPDGTVAVSGSARITYSLIAYA